MIKTIKKIIKVTDPFKVSIQKRYCPVCEVVRNIIRLDNNEMAIRCVVCKASVVSMSIVDVIKQEFSELQDLCVYELSTRGPLTQYLHKKCLNLTTSEFYPQVVSGVICDKVLCQDVQNLTFNSDQFDLCTSTEVFEHVPNDFSGMKNIYRVLKPAGKAIFTVPLFGDTTVQRAKIGINGDIEYLLPIEYHDDPVAESGRIVVFRNYGNDILKLLANVGFKSSKIVSPNFGEYWGIKRDVIVAEK